jgi:hypothetical protein
VIAEFERAALKKFGSFVPFGEVTDPRIGHIVPDKRLRFWDRDE